jgi:hypothetical protein
MITPFIAPLFCWRDSLPSHFLQLTLLGYDPARRGAIASLLYPSFVHQRLCVI